MSRGYLRSPTKFVQERVLFLFSGISDDLAEDRGKLEPMTAVAGGDACIG